MQFVIHLTCCSICTGTFVKTDRLPGPLTINKFGKFGTRRPKKLLGPLLQNLDKCISFLPIIFSFKIDPVNASKPVAKIILSKMYSPFLVLMPFLVILTIGLC